MDKRQLLEVLDHLVGIGGRLDTTNVIDLMDALKKSLGKKAPAKSDPAKHAAASRKIPKRKSR